MLGFELLGWALTGACLGYAYFVHQGIGPSPHGLELRWFEPRHFLYDWQGLGWAFASAPRIHVVLFAPAALLAAGVFIATRSAVARALALSAGVAVLLFTFYGTVAARIWAFFFWRGSAVLAVTALVVGFALAAPLLARSWLRLSWPLRIATWLPPAFVVVAFLRNATGTDPSLRFSISPWPAVSFYGIEVGAFFAMLTFLGAALGAAGAARVRERGLGALAAGVALGLLVPVAVLWLCDLAALPPFRVDARTLVPLAVLCALAIAAATLPGLRRPEALAGRARVLAVGAALIAVPVLGGQILARFDYTWTREHRARELIDALDRYYQRENLYPDELAELVEDGDLAALPRPAIGFGFLYHGTFSYRGFGTSYLLEFPAPRWVQCAYAPPYADEDEDETQPGASAADEEQGEAGLDEAWSCPKRPPELW